MTYYREPHQTGLAALFAALAKARGEFDTIEKNRLATIRMKNGGQYSYKYADLQDVLNATTPALAAYGLVIMQWPVGDNIMTRVGHESGAETVTPWPIKPMPQRTLDDAQSYQSAAQVAKRYALSAILGVSTEETIEGDAKAHRVLTTGAVDNGDPFSTEDGMRAPHGAKNTPKMKPRELAEEAARAIEAQLVEVKTPVGLNGVWNRNGKFIAALQDRHDDLFQNVFDKFHSLMAQMESE